MTLTDTYVIRYLYELVRLSCVTRTSSVRNGRGLLISAANMSKDEVTTFEHATLKVR